MLALPACASTQPHGRTTRNRSLAGVWHTVLANETLVQLARRYAVPLADIEEINGVDRRDPPQPGRRLFIPRNRVVRSSSTGQRRGVSGGIASTSSRERLGGKGAQRASLRWPVPGGVLASSFGKRGSGVHEGIDIAAKAGTPVIAAMDGEVIFAGAKVAGYGNMVLLRHADGLVTVYAHNKRNLVREGQKVRGGEVIAEVGRTGRATGNHLHFEVRVGETPKNPLRYVRQPRPTTK